MRVLRNHFCGKDTILIKNRIINDCQDFKMEDAAAILNSYNVSAETWQEVLDVYTGVSTLKEIEGFLHDESLDVLAAIILHGDLPRKHLKALWGREKSIYMRLAFAKKGFRPTLLSKDPSSEVRRAVAERGDCLRALTRDPDWQVRRAVAAQGQYLQELAGDPNKRVREEVAKRLADIL